LRQLVLAAACAVVAVALLDAQAKPNFSGLWLAVSPAEAAGQEQRVRHTDTTLSTSHDSEGDGHATTYKLDGSESRNELTTHGEKIVTLSKAQWPAPSSPPSVSTTYPDGPVVHLKQWSLKHWPIEAVAH
jgi:hypothetical protein